MKKMTKSINGVFVTDLFISEEGQFVSVKICFLTPDKKAAVKFVDYIAKKFLKTKACDIKIAQDTTERKAA